MSRCDATARRNPGTSLLGPVLGPALDDGEIVTVRCRLDAGHDGPHAASIQPFPGFAPETVRWSDPPPEPELSVPTGGLLVEVDPSLCVVIRQPRTTGPDHVLTITDVDALKAALDVAVMWRDAVEAARTERADPTATEPF